MNISHYPCDGNRAKLVTIQGTNQSKYLQPDYFLSSIQSESYYSRKYGGNHATNNSMGIKPIYQSKSSKIYRVASIMLLSLGFLATAVEVEAENSIELHKEASSGQQKEATFETITLSNNLPDVVPQLPLPDLVPSNPPVTPPPPPPMPPLPDIVPPVILPDVVPVPPAPPVPPMAPNMPDLVSDAGSSKSDKKSALLESIRDFGGKLFKLKKVKQEPKPVVVSSSDQDLVSQLHNTLERRRKGIGCTKLENLVNQILLGDEPEQIQEIALPSGATIGTWKNNTLKLAKNIHIKKDAFLQHIVSFFESSF